MNEEKIVEFLDKIYKWIILITIFVIPVYFNPWLSFGFDKFIILRSVVFLLVFIFGFKIIFSQKLNFYYHQKFLIVISIIFLAQILSTIFSIDKNISFWGAYQRGMGLFNWALIFIWGLFVYDALCRYQRFLKDIFLAIVFGGFLVSIYGIVQATGFDIFSWQEIDDFWHSRISSTLGHPNFFAAFLFFVISAGAYLFSKSQNFYYKIFFVSSLFLNIFCFLFTYSRAAWIGFLGGFIIFLAIFIWKKSKKLFWLFSIFIIFIFLTFFFIFTSSIKSQPSIYELNFQERLKSIFNFSSGSAKARILYYGAAWEIFKERPFIGHGLDSQSRLFPKYYNSEYAIFETINNYPDRAHNEVLEILITVGFLGLLAWIIFGIFVFKNRDKNNDAQFYIFFAIISTLIYLMFNFLTDVIAIFLMIFISAIISKKYQKIEKNFLINNILRFLFLICWGLVFYLLFFLLVISPMMADYYLRQGRKAVIQHEAMKALENFEKMLQYSPKESRYREKFVSEGLIISSGIIDNKKKIEVLRFIKNKVYNDWLFPTKRGREYLAVLLSREAQARLSLGEKKEDIQEFKESERIFKELIFEIPGMARLRAGLGNLYYYQGNYQAALNEYYAALGLYPDLKRPELNMEHRAEIVKEQNLVLKSIIKIKTNDGRYFPALFFIKKGLEADPYDIVLQQQFAFALLETGQKELAEKILQKIK